LDLPEERTLVYRKGNKYFGHLLNGSRHGFGILEFFNNNKLFFYAGNFENGERSGEGTLLFRSGANVIKLFNP